MKIIFRKSVLGMKKISQSIVLFLAVLTVLFF